ncbi:MAG: AmmeMemoRadiSam system protein A [Holophagaceae bacterium]
MDLPEPEDRGPTLLAVAREAIGRELRVAVDEAPRPRWLEEPGNTFVTVRVGGLLHGCVGTVSAPRPLAEDVPANARAAAFRDPRGRPLEPGDWRLTELEVSLLGPREPLLPASEDELRDQLRPGVDGLILEYGAWRGAFLPQVWEALPDPGIFLAQLKLKAGLPPDFWHPDLRASRFTVRKWRERELLAARG